MGQAKYAEGFDKIVCHPECLDEPLHWKKPRKVFVCSMSDLFHPDVSDEFIFAVFDAARAVPQHFYQWLTKRAERMLEVTVAYCKARGLDKLPDNWQGMVTTENQKWADIRIPYLLQSPWALRGVSAEPLLEDISFTHYNHYIDQVIVGGESGPGARPMYPDWARCIRDDCVEAGVPFFFKQWGGVIKKRAGRVLEGRTWNQMPELRVPV